ncbi:MAG: ROK family protein, partial [Sciscionella sp.]
MIRRGPLPRVEIAELTALSSASVTRLTAELIDAGVLRQLGGLSGGRRGAPRMPVDIRTEGFVGLGVHLGQRRANLGLVNLRGDVIERAEFRYKSTQSRAVVTGATRCAQALLDRLPEGARFIGTGIAIGGHVDPSADLAVDNTGLGWADVPLKDLAQRGLPGPVYVQSTWWGLAQTELLLGRTLRSRDFVLLFVGNLIGGAIVIDGKIHTGAHSAAGDIAHLAVSQRGRRCAECRQQNCFVTVAGDQAVLHRAAEDGLLPPDASDEQLAQLVTTTTTSTQRRLLRPRARAIGEVVASLVDILDPETLILADPMYEVPGYRQDLTAGAARRRRNGLDPSRLVHVAPDAVLPAAITALDAFYDDPLAWA